MYTPGREHHDRGVGHAARGGHAEGADQPGRIVGHHLDRLAPEHLGQHPRHGGPVGQHVADTRRAAEVVLEDPELAVLVAHDVDPGHVDAYAVGRVDPVDRPEEARRAGDHVVRDDPVVEDAGAVVDVVEEGLQRPNPLGDALGDAVPLAGGEDPGHDVERKRSLLAVQIEGDALVHEGPGQSTGPGGDVLRAHLRDHRDDVAVVRSGSPGRLEHLVDGVA